MNQTNKVFYTLVAIFLSCSIEMAGQVQKVISGTVTELFGKTAEPTRTVRWVVVSQT